MKTKILSLGIVLVLSGCNTETSSVDLSIFSSKIEELENKIKLIKAQEEADTKLGQYAINMMYRTSSKIKLSDGRKQILARSIVRVANDIFETEDNKKAFIAVLAIESGFDRFAQSPTGPKGLAQLARATFHEAMKDCGVEGLNDDDVWETEINLYAGACYFKKLLIQSEGDPFVAIVAYNQGPNSEAAKTYAKYGSMDNMEALKYVAKFNFLKRKVTDEKTINIPALDDLPKPTGKK